MRACMRACLHALRQYKALDAVLYKWPYLGTGMAAYFRNLIRLSFFLISSEMDVPT